MSLLKNANAIVSFDKMQMPTNVFPLQLNFHRVKQSSTIPKFLKKTKKTVLWLDISK